MLKSMPLLLLFTLLVPGFARAQRCPSGFVPNATQKGTPKCVPVQGTTKPVTPPSQKGSFQQIIPTSSYSTASGDLCDDGPGPSGSLDGVEPINQDGVVEGSLQRYTRNGQQRYTSSEVAARQKYLQRKQAAMLKNCQSRTPNQVRPYMDLRNIISGTSNSSPEKVPDSLNGSSDPRILPGVPAPPPLVDNASFAAAGGAGSTVDKGMEELLESNSDQPVQPSTGVSSPEDVPAPVPTPIVKTSSVADAADVPAPVPSPLPAPDPSIKYDENHPVLKGVGQIATGCLTIAAVCAAGVPTGGLGTAAAVFAVQGAAGNFAAGASNIYSGLSGDATVGQKAEQITDATKNTFGQFGTIISGDLNTGKNIGNITDAIITFRTLPDTDIPKSLGLSLFNANQAATSLEEGTMSLQNVWPLLKFPPQPTQVIAPPSPQPDPTPSQ